MKIMSFLFAAFIATMSWAQNVGAQQKSCDDLRKQSFEVLNQIKNAMEQNRQKDSIPAIAYAIFSENCLITSDSVGTSGNAQNPLSGQKSLFRVASISKLFTALAAAQLIEHGVIQPTASLMSFTRAPFVQYLLRYETPARLERWKKISVSDLLAHQGGISKDLPGSLVFANTQSLAQNSYPSFAELLPGLLRTEFLFEPGHISSGIKYSDLGMNLVARIVEAYNPMGLSFPEYVSLCILHPLGMTNTFYDIPPYFRDNLINSFGVLLPNGTRTPAPKAFFVGSYDGSIGIATSASDLSKLGMELLRIVNGRGTLLKNENLVNWLFQLKSPVLPAIGWASGPLWQYLAADATTLWVGGSGTGPSERGDALVSPEKNLGIAVLFDTKDANRDFYAQLIAESIKGFPSDLAPIAVQRLNHAREFLKSTAPPAIVIPPPIGEIGNLKKYEGTYFADLSGFAQVQVSNDGYLMFAGQKLIAVNPERGIFRYPEIPGTAGIDVNREPVIFKLNDSGLPILVKNSQVKIFQKVN